jgi:hypothetical protein
VITARTHHRAALATFLAAVLAAPGSRALEKSHDERFLDGLRQRGHFELAEKYCADRLADSKLPEARRAILTIELSRTYAAHAAQSPAAAQAALWRKARVVVDQFAATHPDNPRLVLVQMQAVLAGLAQGELALEYAQLADKPSDELPEVRATFRGAIAELKKLDETIAAELQRRGPAARGDDQGQLSAAELASLDLHVRHELARALKNQGLCYPPASPDRINSLGQAIESLAALARHDMTGELAWSVRLDEIACLRLVGNFRDAERKLLQAARTEPSRAIEPKLRAERIRLALARGRIDEALSEAGPAGATKDSASADESLAKLEAYLAGWRRGREQDDLASAQPWEKASVDQVHAIQQAHGAAAARQAETLLARSIVHSAGGENPRVLLLAAQGLYRGGRLDEALAAYDEAAKVAASREDKGTLFDSRYAAAALEYERNNHSAALERFGKLAAEMPSHPRAPEAHLLAIHSAAQVAKRDDPPKLDDYRRLLDEHVRLWPDSPTASQAWWWLGRLAEHSQAWQEAIRALKNVRPDHAQYAPAVEAVGRCYEAALDELHRRGNRNELLARDAVDYLAGVIGRSSGSRPAQAEARRAAVLAAARIYLRELPAGAAQARQLLSGALAGDAAAPRAWKRAASALLVPALAASGQQAAAQDLLGQIPIGSTSEALAMIDMLAAVKSRAPADSKRALAAIELTVIGDLLAKADQLEPDNIKSLARQRAGTLVDLGRRADAVAELRALAQKYPRDGQAQEDVAALLAEGGDAESLQAALVKWREVATHSRPGSERWFRAHFALARLQLELGSPAKARATIKLVQAGHPNLGGAEMKARFTQLLAECERAPEPQRGEKLR